jgi:hypothetical protein
MISGLALGADPKLDVCEMCNFDLSWLINYPSTLLWVDQIILTPEMFNTIKKSHFPEAKQGEAIKTVFERLDSSGLIDIRKVSDVISKSDSEKIDKQIQQDKNALIKTFPNNVRRGNDDKVPGQIFIDKDEYCAPSLWTIYASIELANKWGANLILPDRSYNYLKYKLGLSTAQLQVQKEKVKAFEKIFSSKLPKVDLFPHVLFAGNECETCKNKNSCDPYSISTVEKNVKTLMGWREYDELYQLREVLGRLSKEVAQNEQADADDFVQAFRSEESKIKRKIRLVFPKVERWANLITVLSVPVIVAGISTGSAPVATIGAAVAGVATVTSKYIDTLKSKHRWIGFRDQL